MDSHQNIKPKKRLPVKRLLTTVIIAGGVAAGLLALFVDISEKKAEERQFPFMLTKLSDDQVQPSLWGQSFPAQYSRYKLLAEKGETTPFGGGVPYSKLIRSPALTKLWAGYPFSADFNEERSHFYSQVDQIETKRNDTAWLNSHGFPAFKGQPGACMNCHSGWAPSLIRELGWETFNHTPYSDLKSKLLKDHGEGMEGHALGSTCADCHHPSDMSLRVTRPAYIEAMAARGYTRDDKTGLKATNAEMRSHVCQQCHVEYYFKGENKVLTFPWNDWPKDEPLKIEMIEAYYDRAAADPKGFKADWTHKDSKTPMLKMQHPETELFSSGLHAQSNVSCTDCHMPYRRDGAVKVTDHFIRSPLFNINAACQTCHRQTEEALRTRVERIQMATATSQKQAEGFIMALIDDIKNAESLLQAKYAKLDPEAQKAEIDKVLSPARSAHRRASMRWDFIASENSTGFHSPREAARVLGDAMHIARTGTLTLTTAMQALHIDFKPTLGYGTVPNAPEPIAERHAPVGDAPPSEMSTIDQSVSKGMVQP